MLMIRLQRVGRKNDPSFRVVLTDKRTAAKTGRFIEVLGSYDARQEEKTQLKKERIEHWLSKGAQLSASVHNLLLKHKIIQGSKIDVSAKSKKNNKDASQEEVSSAKGQTNVAETAESTPDQKPAENEVPTDGGEKGKDKKSKDEPVSSDNNDSKSDDNAVETAPKEEKEESAPEEKAKKDKDEPKEQQENTA